MRVFLARVFPASGVHVWSPAPGHVAGASWVDGRENVMDTCQVTLAGAAPQAGGLKDYQAMLLVPPGPGGEWNACYGPYDITPYKFTGEDRALTLNGAIGDHFSATIADRDDESGIWQSIGDQVDDHISNGREPLAWWTSAGNPYRIGAQTIKNLITGSLYSAQDLAGVRQALEAWGLTAVAGFTHLGESRFRPAAQVLSLYPQQLFYSRLPFIEGVAVREASFRESVGGDDGPLPRRFRQVTYSQLHDDWSGGFPWHAIKAHPDYEVPDKLNEPGDYRQRQILVLNRIFSDSAADTSLLTAGTERPPVYLPQANGGPYAKQAEELERWKLQNNAATLRLERTVTPDYNTAGAAYPQVGRILTLPASALPDGHQENAGMRRWLVRRVNHRWDPSSGYVQTLDLSLWQGLFEHVEAENEVLD